jgi:hypothetical protein
VIGAGFTAPKRKGVERDWRGEKAQRLIHTFVPGPDRRHLQVRYFSLDECAVPKAQRHFTTGCFVEVILILCEVYVRKLQCRITFTRHQASWCEGVNQLPTARRSGAREVRYLYSSSNLSVTIHFVSYGSPIRP